MNIRNFNRQDKIKLLTSLLNGKISLADLHQNGETKIKVWSEIDTDLWIDEKGKIAKKADIAIDDIDKVMTYGGTINVFVVGAYKIPPCASDENEIDTEIKID